MEIIIQPRILDSDIWNTRVNTSAFVVPEITVSRGIPDLRVIVGALRSNDDGNMKISIIFHAGKNSWCFGTEHSAQIATTYEPGILPDLMERFEREIGAKLPDVKIIEPGVGVYSAKSRYISDNPWALEDGEIYAVTRSGKERQYLASVKHGRTQVADVTDGNMDTNEFYCPKIIFDAEAWRTLHQVSSDLKKRSMRP